MTATTLGDVSRLASDILIDDVLIDVLTNDVLTNDVLTNDVLTNDVLITTPGRFFRRTLRQHILRHRENPFVIESFSRATRGP